MRTSYIRTLALLVACILGATSPTALGDEGDAQRALEAARAKRQTAPPATAPVVAAPPAPLARAERAKPVEGVDPVIAHAAKAYLEMRDTAETARLKHIEDESKTLKLEVASIEGAIRRGEGGSWKSERTKRNKALADLEAEAKKIKADADAGAAKTSWDVKRDSQWACGSLIHYGEIADMERVPGARDNRVLLHTYEGGAAEIPSTRSSKAVWLEGEDLSRIEYRRHFRPSDLKKWLYFDRVDNGDLVAVVVDPAAVRAAAEPDAHNARLDAAYEDGKANRNQSLWKSSPVLLNEWKCGRADAQSKTKQP